LVLCPSVFSINIHHYNTANTNTDLTMMICPQHNITT
jgi:hypothetical protein